MITAKVPNEYSLISYHLISWPNFLLILRLSAICRLFYCLLFKLHARAAKQIVLRCLAIFYCFLIQTTRKADSESGSLSHLTTQDEFLGFLKSWTIWKPVWWDREVKIGFQFCVSPHERSTCGIQNVHEDDPLWSLICSFLVLGTFSLPKALEKCLSDIDYTVKVTLNVRTAVWKRVIWMLIAHFANRNLYLRPLMIKQPWTTRESPLGGVGVPYYEEIQKLSARANFFGLKSWFYILGLTGSASNIDN